jgi:hypothetical protein
MLEGNFPMQEIACPLDFPIISYDNFSGGYTEGPQPHESTSGVDFLGDISHA